jgi:glycosyltransferase involved in cell wall biosynthesis
MMPDIGAETQTGIDAPGDREIALQDRINEPVKRDQAQVLRILFSHRVGSRDGQSVHIDELVSAFRALGHEVCVVGPPVYERSEFGGDSSLVVLVRRYLPNAAAELAELAYNIPAYWRLRRAAKAFKPDVVYERYNLFFLVGSVFARLHDVPLYMEVNAPLADERSRFSGLGLKSVARATERSSWRAATKVFTVTKVLKDLVAAGGVAAERIEVTPNGTDLARFMALPERETDTNGVVLGFVGFMRDWHGLETVIRAIARHGSSPPVQLLIAGEGPARQGLEQLTSSLGVEDRVKFLGLAKRSEIPDLVGSFDIALQPRAVSYASPLKLFEYMAAGCAIVAPDQPNIREVLTHGTTALLFDPDKDDTMWDCVMTLLANPQLRRKLGAAARAEIQERDFTWLANARRVSEWMHLDLEKNWQK